MSVTVAKPSGIPVFPPHDDPSGDCVLARLMADAPSRLGVPWPEGFAGGIAHRLDTQTSGALLVADDPEELVAIREAFASRAFVKTYRFVAAREVPWDANHCARSIAHDRRRRRRMIVQRGPSTPHRGRWLPAETHFRRLGPCMWEATMRTGVMHQIRVHAAFLGLALAGDRLYGGGPGGFRLHHVGLSGGRWSTSSVPLPAWARV